MITDKIIEKLKKEYPFQYYTFSKISIIKESGFDFEDYSFCLDHNHELYIGNINGLICRNDMGYPLKLLKYLKEEPDTLKKREVTFILPENYKDSINQLKGLRKTVLDVFNSEKYKDKQIHIITYKIDNSDIINKIEGLKNMKFDVCIGNPPFSGKGNPLYLQILEICNIVAKNIVWICPSQWVKNYKDDPYLTKVKTKTCRNLIKHFHIQNPFNDACVANDIGIYVFGIAEKYENYDAIKLEKFTNPKLAKNIWKKFENYTNRIEQFSRVDYNLPFYVKAQWIRGHYIDGKPLWDWTTLFSKEQHIDFEKHNLEAKTTSKPHFWNFATKIECQNFIDSTETDICMFAHYITKINQANNNQNIELIPWFFDYTHKWTEEMMAKILNLTDEEVIYIHEEMKDFGWKAATKK